MIACAPFSLPDRAAMVLRLIAGAEDVGTEEALLRAIVHSGEHVVGLPGLADAAAQSGRFQAGYDSLRARTTAATQSRLPGHLSNDTPPESDRGGGGNPAAPAGGCGPP